ncbi:MAG: PIG-L deacetylase family protein [Chloroflexota bacterium]
MTVPDRAPGGVLVIVAHPDDAEFMCAGSIAAWVQEGRDVHYVLCTSGDKGTSDPDMSPTRLAEIRQREQRAACDVLGVGEIVFLGHEDGVLEPSLELRREIVREIRRFRPSIVVCQDPTTRWTAQQYLNHPDHRAAGSVTLDAVYPSARDPHVFPDLLAAGFEPHKVEELYIGGTSSADVWIDIGLTIDVKVAALRQHESQVGNGQRDRDIADFIYDRARSIAEGQSMEFAEAFKYMSLR